MPFQGDEPPQERAGDDRWRFTLRAPSWQGPEATWALALEVVAVLLVFAMAVALRVIKLSTIPKIVTADEADNLQVAYHIMHGTGPGFFGFDWKPAPIFSLYPFAWTMQIFGDSISDFRLFPVILSLFTIIAFYFLARRSMGPFAALAALALLSTNLYFLHFSRTAWDNMNAALFAVGACYATQRALEERSGWAWAGWWTASGVFVAFGLYGYFTGRFIFVAVMLMTVTAVALRIAPWRQAFGGLMLASVVSAALFAPMAVKIYDNWDYFNQRTKSISVFEVHEDEPYEGDTDGWVIAAKNVVRNYKGFVLQDGSEMTRGIWPRYNPEHRAPLDFISTHLFWGGLIVGAIRFRKTYGWWAFFAPLFIAESFSVGTPDLARGLLFAPFYFLFIGLLFDEALKLVKARADRYTAALAIASLVAFIGTVNVTDYFEWQNEPGAQIARMPGIDPCEFGLWRGLAVTGAKKGEQEGVDPVTFDRLRRELDCSDLVREWLP
ncbi:MAG: glycosyltransferase family 39 protein [Dehalococcoidia bacterium]